MINATQDNNITFFHYGVLFGVLLCLFMMTRNTPKADSKPVPNFKPHVVKPGEAS